MLKRLVLLIAVIGTLASPAIAQTWQIDTAHSAAHFAVKHNLIAMVRGTFDKVTGTVEFDGKDITKDGVHHFGALASGKIKRTDFGMKWANAVTVAGMAGIDISDEVDITLDVEVLRKP